MNNSKTELLNPKDRAALEKFKTLLNERLPGLIEEVILFGSKARGDARPDSDMDILVIISKGDWHMRDLICNISTDVFLETEVLLSAKTITREEYKLMMERENNFLRNVIKEGIPA